MEYGLGSVFYFLNLPNSISAAEQVAENLISFVILSEAKNLSSI
jgi:hypothetical protein